MMDRQIKMDKDLLQSNISAEMPQEATDEPESEYQRLAIYAEKLVAGDHALAKSSWILLWTVVFLGYASNTFLLFLFIRFRKTALKTPANILILSLVCVDLCALLVMTLIEAHFKFHIYKLDICIGVSFSVNVFSAMFAAFVVSAMAGQKFVAVFFPFKAKVWLQRKTAVITVCIALCVTIALIAPLWIIPADVVVLNGNDTADIYTLVAITGKDYIGYAMTLEAIAACTATAAIATTHPAIIYKLCKRKFTHNRRYKEAIKLAIVMVMVFVIYLFLALSKNVTWYVLALSEDAVRPPVSNVTRGMIKYWVFMSNPVTTLHVVFNPVLHALVTETFRKYYIPFACSSDVSSSPISTQTPDTSRLHELPIYKHSDYRA